VSVLGSALDTRGAEYASRRAAMLARLAELDAEVRVALGDQVQAGDVLAIVDGDET
jgi:hypothetical protein